MIRKTARSFPCRLCQIAFDLFEVGCGIGNPRKQRYLPPFKCNIQQEGIAISDALLLIKTSVNPQSSAAHTPIRLSVTATPRQCPRSRSGAHPYPFDRRPEDLHCHTRRYAHPKRRISAASPCAGLPPHRPIATRQRLRQFLTDVYRRHWCVL